MKTFKLILKISLIVIPLIVIGILIFKPSDATEERVDKVIAASQFEKQIEKESASTIRDKDYKTAKAAFNSLIDKITTEASVTMADGSKKVSDEEVRNCRKIAFTDYANVFIKTANEYFERSTWTDSEVKEYGAEASRLKGLNIAERTSDFDRISKTADSYFAAWHVCRSASSCSSVSAVKSVISNGNKYLNDPAIHNCSSLHSALAEVPSKAKSSYASYVTSKCNSVVHNCTNSSVYHSYADFYNAYEASMRLIDEYTSNFGNSGSISGLKSSLRSADQRALDALD